MIPCNADGSHVLVVHSCQGWDGGTQTQPSSTWGSLEIFLHARLPVEGISVEAVLQFDGMAFLPHDMS